MATHIYIIKMTESPDRREGFRYSGNAQCGKRSEEDAFTKEAKIKVSGDSEVIVEANFNIHKSAGLVKVAILLVSGVGVKP